ncbi:MAG: hypothetical protein R2729_11875 [Bryobacteraceae bacterium]
MANVHAEEVYAGNSRSLELCADWLVVRWRGEPDWETGVRPAIRAAKAARLGKAALAGVRVAADISVGALPAYARLLGQVRAEIGRTNLSIATPLAWFVPGSDVGKVIAIADEFVPVFYVLGVKDDRYERPEEPLIVEPKWGAVFEGFGKPYRIGLTAAGRARSVRRRCGTEFSSRSEQPLMRVARNTAFEGRTIRNANDELVLSYRVIRSAEIGYHDYEPGGALDYVVATAETIREMIARAMRMGPRCAGVIFSSSGGELGLDAEERRSVIAGSAAGPRVEIMDRFCAAVRGRMRIGRATTASPAIFTVEEVR